VQKIVTIVGARPQFVKAGVVSRALRRDFREILVHTGQHYDVNMSDIFFRDLEIPEPQYCLGVGSGSHGAQTGRMLEAIETVLQQERPDLVLIYGDTNSTLAGALAAAKLHIPVAHVEAGLRSFNRRMPEEINRILADHVSTWLFPPTATAVEHLRHEGITAGVHQVGDVMYDTFLFGSALVAERSRILESFDLGRKQYSLLTLHRAENTDDPERLTAIVNTLNETGQRIIFPVHPRTRQKLKELGAAIHTSGLTLVDPVGYFDMLNLELHAAVIFTDSGGVQKEAYMAKVPCITLRDETEWLETVTVNWNRLAGADPDAIRAALALDWVGADYPPLFGDGKAAQKIAHILAGHE
jgi:UDP-N-acetylglucosamine 2-epimerase